MLVTGERLHRVARTHRSARKIRNAQQRYRAKDVGTQQRRIPCHRCAPIVAGDHRRLDAEAVDQPDDIADEVQDVVRLDRGGRVGLPVAALVGRDDAKACRRERGNLMPPRVPRLGPSVAQHDQRTRALLDVMHPDAIGVDEFVLKFRHRKTSCPGHGLRMLELFDFLGHFGDCFEQIGDQSVVGDRENRRLFVLVDRADDFRVFHPGQMLNRT